MAGSNGEQKTAGHSKIFSLQPPACWKLMRTEKENQMRHFVAYHKTQRMGRPLSDGDPLSLQTNK